MDLNDELLSLREENKELRKELALLIERIKNLEEENRRLKEENQKLRLSLFGFKPPRKQRSEGSDDVPKTEPKKLGPPVGHKYTWVKPICLSGIRCIFERSCFQWKKYLLL